MDLPDGVVLTEGIGGVLRRIIAEYPASKATKPGAGVVRNAVESIARRMEFDGNEFAAACWLLRRVRAWAASPRCKAIDPAYGESLTNWLAREKYDGSDAEWATVPASGGAEQTEAPTADHPFLRSIK